MAPQAKAPAVKHTVLLRKAREELKLLNFALSLLAEQNILPQK